MGDVNDDVRGGEVTTQAESSSNAGDSSRTAFNPWDFKLTRPSEIANWIWVAIAVAIGLASVVFAPRDGGDLFRVLDRGGGWTAGWPWRFHTEKWGAVNAHDGLALVGYSNRPWAFAADLLVAMVLLASLPALRTFNLAPGRFVWRLRDMLVLMCGAALFLAALPREGFPCFGVISLGAAPAFISAPAAVFLLTSWGWRRLVRRPDAASGS